MPETPQYPPPNNLPRPWLTSASPAPARSAPTSPCRLPALPFLDKGKGRAKPREAAPWRPGAAGSNRGHVSHHREAEGGLSCPQVSQSCYKAGARPPLQWQTPTVVDTLLSP